jgi:hypothetical protein
MSLTEAHDPFTSRAQFEYQYCFCPRRCYNSGKWIWLETAMRGRRIITGPGEPITEDRWYNSNEALIMMIKGVA